MYFLLLRMRLEKKQIVVGVTGSISAYKVPELLRLLQKEGADVQVMMSPAAEKFVAPFTLAALSGKKVLRDMFDEEDWMAHIQTSRRADILVVAPASANTIAKLAHGMADGLIAATVLAARCPVLIVPSMNDAMWHNPLVQMNVGLLRKAGYTVLEPGVGELACGEEGDGRLPDLSLIVYEIVRLVTSQDLKKKKVLITGGPTREFADPVRFLSNPSSGKMGAVLALEAYARGARVTLVAGSGTLPVLPSSVEVRRVVSAEEMHLEVMSLVRKCDVFVASAAVSDYRFKSLQKQKIKKGSAKIVPELVPTPDILHEVGQLRSRPFMVGFALESEKMVEYARAKMKRKKADLMVVNGPSAFAADVSDVVLLSPKRELLRGEYSKEMIARAIFDHAVKSFRV